MRRADRVAREPRADRDRSARRSASSLVHTPARDFRWRLPFTFSTFDYRTLCALLRRAGRRGVRDGEGRRAHRHRPSTPTAATCRAPLIVDALGWRRVLSARRARDPAAGGAAVARASRSTRTGNGDDLELWLDPAYVRAGYSWSFPAGDELRVGVGSFDPRDHVKEPTVRLAERPRRAGRALPGQLDPAPDAPPDRGRRLLRRRHGRPLPADDGRGHPHGALLRPGLRPRAARVVEGRQDRAQALARYAAFCDRHRAAVPLAAARAEPRLAREPDAR